MLQAFVMSHAPILGGLLGVSCGGGLRAPIVTNELRLSVVNDYMGSL